MTTLPPLVGVAEIGRLLGLSKQRANAITTQPGLDFPAPVADLAMGRVWRRTDVERWIAEHRPGKNKETR